MSASVGLPLLLCCFTSDPLTSQEEFVTLVTALSRIPTDRASPFATGRPSMSTTTPGTAFLPSPTGPTVLTGTPVVPGVALGPVVRPAGAVRLPTGDEAALDEAVRPEEKARFQAAADTVADRLGARAAAATGVSAEVLS